jgi:hypothetical protein
MMTVFPSGPPVMPKWVCQSFRVNGFGFVVDVGVVFGVDVGVVFGSVVVVVFGDGLQGKGAVPLPLRPRRKELKLHYANPPGLDIRSGHSTVK